jgi:bacillolysin
MNSRYIGIRAYCVLFIWWVLSVWMPGDVAAQALVATQARVDRAIQKMESVAGERVDADRSPVTGLASFIRVGPLRLFDPLAASPESRSLQFLRDYGDAFAVTDVRDVRVVGITVTDVAGMQHVRLQQLHRGVPVTGGELIVHLKGASVSAVNARTLPDLADFDTSPAISAEQALASARTLAENQLGMSGPQYSSPRLEIFNLGLLVDRPYPTRLAWFIESRDTEHREFIWIDALRGEILLHFNQFVSGLNRSIYSTRHSTLLPGILIRREGEPQTGDSDSDAAYQYVGDAYQYFLNQFGRDSYDGNGSPAISTVHYAVGYNNASWDGDELIFGDEFSQADDVVAHEWTHAVTEHTANLFYYNQSGALNESISDIFGETVDLLNGSGNDASEVRWQQGEDLPTGAIRNMMNPPAFQQPAKLGDAGLVACDRDDNGGIHTNSGILNHAYALMVDGGTYNGFVIQGIGLIKAGRIVYHALTSYLISSSTFLDTYRAINQAATDLIGISGITVGDISEVKKALDAVEMSSPWPCGTSAPPIPDLVRQGSVPLTIAYDDLENIESDLWTTRTLWGINQWTGGAGTEGLYWSAFSRSGIYHFWGSSGSLNDSSSAIEMTRDILIPPNARLQFSHAYDFYGDGIDGGMIEYSEDGGGTWMDAGLMIVAGAAYNGVFRRSTLSPQPPAFVGRSNGYTGSQLDLASLSGKAVRFRFRMDTSSWQLHYGEYSQWFIDDIRIYQAFPAFTISVARDGEGSGTVVSAPSGIQCGNQCGYSFPGAANVRLMAIAGANSVFTGWQGACAGEGDCDLAPAAEGRYVIAHFSPLNCRIQLSATVIPFNARGGSGVVPVSVQGGCKWTGSAGFSSSWIRIEGDGSGVGGGQLRFETAPNIGAYSRKGSITIGDQSVLILQAGSQGWTAIGPHGGIVNAVGVSAANPEIIYIATEHGVLKSIDKGARWSLVSQGPSLVDVHAVAVDPTDARVVFAGTYGSGLFKSVDGGEHWDPCNEGIDSADLNVKTIAIDPRNPKIIHAGLWHFYTSLDGGAHWLKTKEYVDPVSITVFGGNQQVIYLAGTHLLRSSDGGMNWEYRGDFYYNLRSVAVHPSNPDTVLVGLSPSGMSRSTDGGITWTVVSAAPPSGVLTIAFDPVSPNIIYAGTWGDSVYRSLDGGITWSPSGNRLPNGFIQHVFLDPADPRTIYVATHGGGIYKSADRGQLYSKLSQDQLSTAVQLIRLDPKDARVLFAATDGGIFRSSDGGLTWQERNTGLEDPDVRGIAIHPDNTNVIDIGTKAGLFRSSDGGLHWSKRPAPTSDFTKSVYDVVAAPGAPDHLYIITDVALYRSFDDGATWTATETTSPSVVTVDRTNAGIVYAPSAFTFDKSTDGGVTWKHIDNGTYPAVSGASLEIDPMQPRRLYMGRYGWGQTLYVSTDEGESWARSDSGLPASTVNALAIDASDVVYAGTQGAGVFESIDHGAHWTEFSEGLTSLEVRDLTADLQNPGLIYAATGSGVFRHSSAPACQAEISPGGAEYGSEGGTGAILIAANSSCNWRASSSGDWIRILSGSAGRGEGSVAYRIEPNPTANSRSGSISAAGWSFTIEQAGTAIRIYPATLLDTIAGSRYEQKLDASGGSAPYRFEILFGSLPPGISLSNAGLISGIPEKAGLFSFTVLATDVLNGTTLADFSINVGSACTARLLSPGIAIGSGGGQASLEIATGDTCAWAVAADSKASWISFRSGQTGKGNGTVFLSVAANVGQSSRSVLLQVLDQTFTVFQEGRNQWTGIGPNHSQIRLLKIDPVDPAVIYAGTASGLFKTSDRGSHWISLNPATAGTVQDLAIDPKDHRNLYALEFEGLWKSTDGGQTWALKQKGIRDEPISSLISVAIHPENSKIVLAGDSYGVIYKTTDGGENWQPLPGLYTSIGKILFDPSVPETVYAMAGNGLYKSSDGGNTWTLRLQNIGFNSMFDMAIAPSNPVVLYLATSNGIIRSPDAGLTFEIIGNGIPIFAEALQVTVAPSNGNVVYAFFTNFGLYRSTDAGRKWAPVSTQPFRREENPDYAVALAIDPGNENLLYVGCGIGVYASRDAGLRWSSVNLGLPQANVNAIRVNPDDPDVVFAATFANGWFLTDGLYRSRDQGTSWEKVLGKMNAYDAAFDPRNPDIIYLATDDGPLWSVDGGTNWNPLPVIIGDFGYPIYSLAVDGVRPENIYLGSFGAGIIETSDGGQTWSVGSSEMVGNFPVNAVAVDAADHRIVYAGSWRGVHKSTDAGRTWHAADDGLTDPYVKSIVVDPWNLGTLFVGTMNQGVFKSTDQGASWHAVNYGLADLYTTALAIRPAIHGQLFAGTKTHGVFTSVDGGRSWYPLNEGLPDQRILSLEVDAATATLYVGTEGSGIFRARIGGPNSISIPGGGASVTSTAGSGAMTQVGYAETTIESGTAPYALAAFSFKQNGVTISEAGVPASPPTTSARIFIDRRVAVNALPAHDDAGTVDINTGIAVANRGVKTANVTYILRDLNGNILTTGRGTIAAGSHFAKFIDQFEEIADGFSMPADFSESMQFGSLDLQSDQPISVLALRGTTNQIGEFLLTTTPVADLTKSAGDSPLFYPQFADGGGYTTSLLLLNTSRQTETGTLQILSNDGAPLIVNQVGGTADSSFRYSIPRDGAFRFQSDGFPVGVKTGWVRLIPDAGSKAPVSSGVFGFNPEDRLVTESGIPAASPTKHARVYVDLSGDHNTGLAISNLASGGAAITISAYKDDGVTAVGTTQGPLQLPANGHDAKFVDQFVSDLPAGFTGVLDISSVSPFAALAIRSLVNERQDFLLTTFPIAYQDQVAPSPIVFPQIADGGGYTTQFVMISAGGSSVVVFNFYQENGKLLAKGN